MKRDFIEFKRAMKSKICLVDLTPHYPIDEFIGWVEQENIRCELVAVLLATIQTELDTEEIILRRSCQLIPDNLSHLKLHSQWQYYCSQLRAYYKALILTSA